MALTQAFWEWGKIVTIDSSKAMVAQDSNGKKITVVKGAYVPGASPLWSSVKQPAQTTQLVGTKTSSPTSTNTLKAYDTNNNNAVVYVKPWVPTPGVSLTPPPTTNATTDQVAKDKAVTDKSAADKAEADQMNSFINTLNPDGTPKYDEATKVILRQIYAETLKSGTNIKSPADLEKIITQAATNAATSTNEYAGIQTTRNLQDLQNKMSDIRNRAGLYNQQEQKTYAETLQKTKDSLRARWLTFSWASRNTLWAQSALASTKPEDLVNWVAVEWQVPQERRYDVSGKMNSFKQEALNAWLTAERLLGSAEGQGVKDANGNIIAFSNRDPKTWQLYQPGMSAGLLDANGKPIQIADPYAGGTTYDPSKLMNMYDPNQAKLANGTVNTQYVWTGDAELQRLKDLEIKKQANLKALTVWFN